MRKQDNKLILQYVLPSIAAMAVSFAYNVVDGMFVGQGVGTNALAAVNITVPFTEITTALACMFSTGGASVFAIRKGRGEDEKANQAFLTSAILVVAMGIIATFIGLVFPTPIARLFGATDVLLSDVTAYIRGYFAFAIFFVLTLLGSFFVRNDGSPTLASVAMITGAIANIFLDWLFVFPLQMGIFGAAIASGLGQVFSCIILAFHFIRKKGILRFKKYIPDATIIKKVCVRGLPELIMEMSQPITIFWYNRTILKYADEPTLGCFSAVTYSLLIVLGILMGVSQGMQPLVGNSFGAKKEKDTDYFFRAALLINGMLAVGLYLIYFFCGKTILSLFITEPELVPTAYDALGFYGASFIPAALNLIFIMYFQSTKRTAQATSISLSRGFILNSIFVPLIPALFGTGAIWTPMIIAEGLSLLIAVCISIGTRKKNTTGAT